MIANQIEEVLNQLSESNYDRVIFDGQWGIGKTKHVKDFIKSNTLNTCYVSLFGKNSVKDIVEEIYFKLIQEGANGKFKEYLNKTANKLKGVNFSYLGISLSIPILADLYSKMYSELEEKESYVLIFDDLERKHDELSLKELLGLFDHLGNINGVKIVLVSFAEMLSAEDKEVLAQYKEKSIDRTYYIDRYSEKAPIAILGKDRWNAIENISSLLDFRNLRTFQKTNQFISEILGVLGEDVFSKKFSKDDVYKMCFATVVFIVEHGGQKLLVEEDIRNTLKSESETIDYIYNCILNNSLDNMMNKRILFDIKRWYETGEYDIDIIKDEINFINSFINEDPINFLSSEEEIHAAIQKAQDFFEELTGNESIDDVIRMLSNVIGWADILRVEDGLEKEELLLKIKPNIMKHVDIEKTLFDNEVIVRSYASTGKDKSSEMILLINEDIIFEYYNQLTDKIIESFSMRNYDSYRYLKTLMESVLSIRNERSEVWRNIINKIKENEFFFPLPKGKISQNHWDWCLINNQLIKRIDENYKEGFYEEYKKNIIKRASEYQDLVLQHRIKMFNWNGEMMDVGEYLIL